MKYWALGFRPYVFAIVLSVTVSAFGESTVVETKNGREDDEYASGYIMNERDTAVASWSLSTSVSDTDFLNVSVVGGESGLQYVMRNTVESSEHTNQVRFDVTPLYDDDEVAITLAQSIYAEGGYWNGGWNTTTSFGVNWDSAFGMARIADPDDQILGLSDGDYVQSPAMIQLSSNQVRNREDSWSIALPAGVHGVALDWSAVNPPTDGTDLNFEWVSFTPHIVYDPDSPMNPGGFVRCDSDGDDDCELDDMLAFYQAAGESVTPETGFDFDGDGVINAGDIDGWLAVASSSSNLANPDGRTHFIGDADFDFDVDSSDLGLLLNNFGTVAYDAGLGAGWNGGDLNMDGSVASDDLGLLLNNFGATSTVPVASLSQQAVPEPNAIPSLLLAAAFLFGRKRRRCRCLGTR